ncbi:FecR family protein [Sphingobacterium faecale]|uniref:FecR domain-containing protein n=1 Tax=Sphingobacterium faecale TaxID=2803775 RepID=A0ABS1R709_9SPHI|nr:FecR domain-containing protein [Sphingobacterium faecale]MBL1409792.1 FecR domain-containing protein [Sphingobacterium faecale]
MNVNPYIESLFRKYLDDDIELSELKELYRYFDGERDSRELKQLVLEKLNEQNVKPTCLDGEKAIQVESAAWIMIKAYIQNDRQVDKTPWRFSRKWLSYAASILVLLGVSIGIYYYKQGPKEIALVSKYGGDLLPSVNNTIITLSDGSQFDLNESKNGIHISEDGIHYDDGSLLTSDISLHATVSTSKGGQYRITLPDGTKVILNAASSFSYPTRFAKQERRVYLDGEGYFEVTKDSARPFVIDTKTQQVEVIGTSFNLSVYAHTPTVTTLVEGIVNLKGINNVITRLEVGQQAIQRSDGYSIHKVETSDYTAWIRDQFVFNNMSLLETFAQLERWYDITFECPKELTNQRIYAEIGRDRKLSKVLETLEEVLNLKFRIEGRRVIVSK